MPSIRDVALLLSSFRLPAAIAHDDRVPRAHLEHRIAAVPDLAVEQFGFQRVDVPAPYP